MVYFEGMVKFPFNKITHKVIKQITRFYFLMKNDLNHCHGSKQPPRRKKFGENVPTHELKWIFTETVRKNKQLLPCSHNQERFCQMKSFHQEHLMADRQRSHVSHY
jgi:hypothetical protein